MIATHNFMHLFPAPTENAFSFSQNTFLSLLTLLRHEPENLVRVSLSFFGHFGVQIFIFLSAYGLTKKYSHYHPKYLHFIGGRILKIYPNFILSILAWAIITGCHSGLSGPLKVLYMNSDDLILKLTLLSNFIPDKSLSPVGPWWFIPFIFQFYFTFPILLTLYCRFGSWLLFLIAVLSIIFSIISQGKIGNVNIYFTLLGHLPELCLGIYLSKKDHAGMKIPAIIILSALTIFILGNIYKTFWHVNHISFLIVLLAIFNYFIIKIKDANTAKKVFIFFGKISLPLFLVNGFLRQPYISWAIGYNHWFLTIILCLLFLLVSVVVALALLKIESRLFKSSFAE